MPLSITGPKTDAMLCSEEDRQRKSSHRHDRNGSRKEAGPEFLPEELEEPSVVLETLKDGKVILLLTNL